MSTTNFGRGHAAQAQEAPVRGSGDGYSLRSRSVDASATVGHRRPTLVRYPKGPESTLDTEIEFGNVIEQQNSTHTSQNFTILPWPQQFVTWRVAYTCRPYHRRWENCILFLIALLCLLLCSIYAVLFTGSRIAQRHVLYYLHNSRTDLQSPTLSSMSRVYAARSWGKKSKVQVTISHTPNTIVVQKTPQ